MKTNIQVFINGIEVKTNEEFNEIGDTMGWDLINYIDTNIDQLLEEELMCSMLLSYEGNRIKLIKNV